MNGVSIVTGLWKSAMRPVFVVSAMRKSCMKTFVVGGLVRRRVKAQQLLQQIKRAVDKRRAMLRKPDPAQRRRQGSERIDVEDSSSIAFAFAHGHYLATAANPNFNAPWKCSPVVFLVSSYVVSFSSPYRVYCSTAL